MPVYTVEVTFGDDPDLRESIRPEHRRYIERVVEEGAIWLTGPWDDGSGGMLIFEVPDKAALDRIVAGDPYTPAGVVRDRRIRAWGPLLGSLLPTTGTDSTASWPVPC